MTDLLAARGQMAISLGFHILFAVAGMAMPLLMALAEWRFQRRGDPIDAELARRWAKGTAILFAVGAVSGTVLSFELGLLWPEFMRFAGPLVGMPFSLEGFAFFLEAICLGLYLYGRDRLPPRLHLASAFGVALSGLLSAVFVTAVNGWMNDPTGYTLQGGELVDVRPWEAMANPAWLPEALHMSLAAYVAIAFAVMGIHGWRLRRSPDDPFHRRAFAYAFGMALVAMPLQILSGDLAAKHIADRQPIKLAAAEGLFETQTGAPLSIGGWPDEDARELRGAIEIPYGLSILAQNDPHAEVVGLDAVPRDLWPPVAVVHVAFQIMVACGFTMLAYVGIGGILWLRARPPPWAHRRFVAAAPWLAPLGLVAIEAGWTVTEVGRQPWIIKGIMRTSEAVTPMPGLQVPFLVFTALYLVLGVVVIVLLRGHVLAAGGPPR
jgi:cytochrome d ubiquinol oxidase subunit I